MPDPSTARSPGPRVQWVRYGPRAFEALAAALAVAQAGDPLARVTVLVPTRLTGLVLRRALASRPGGIAGVQFEVLDQVAERLAGPGVAADGTSRLLDAADAVVVARAARDHPGAMASLVERPATLDALVDAVMELRAIPHDARPTAWAALASADEDHPGIRSALGSIARRHQDLVHAGHHDDSDLLARAAMVPAVDVVAAVGQLVVHLPVVTSPLQARLLSHLGTCTPTTVIAGMTGDSMADELVATTVADICGGPILGPGPVLPDPTTHPDVVVVPDAEEEVRHVAREVASALHDGTDISRMQVLWTTDEPYASLATELFAAAGLPCNGPSTTTLGHTIVGRTLRGLVAWQDDGLPRQGLLDLLATIPARHDGAPTPTADWIGVANAASIVGGLDHWDARLAGHVEELLAEATNAPDWLSARLRTAAQHAKSLRACSLSLHRLLIDRPSDWAGWGAWATDLLNELLGVGRDLWPAADREAEGQIRQALEGFGDLDALQDPDRAVPRWQFLQQLEAVLVTTLGRTGTVGTGVHLGPLRAAGHADASRTWILGATEGALPARPGRHPFLDDATIRRLADAGAQGPATTRVRQAMARHALARTMAGGGRTTFTVPRADRRAGRPARPGPWVLELLGGHERPVSVDDVLDPAATHDLPVLHVASAAVGIVNAPVPAGPAEWRRRALLAAVSRRLDVASHPLAGTVDGLATAVVAQRARSGPDFTPWDGNLAEIGPAVAQLAGRPQSPSTLANYGSCPRSWLFAQGLRLRAPREPRLWHDVDALDRGRLVHDTLEAWVAHMHGLDDGPPTPWADATCEPDDRDGARLLTRLFAQRAARLEDTGRVTSASTFWQLERQRLLHLLHLWHGHHRRLVDAGHVPVSVEWSFGLGEVPPLEVTTPSGITFHLRGRVDRIDVDGAGRMVVWDYKTGRPIGPRALTSDIALQGTQLQLPAYALAALHLRGAAQVSVGYWHVHDEARPPAAVPVDATARARIDEVFDTIGAGMAAGMFAAHPGDEQMFPRMSHEHCLWCPFDRICESHGQRAAAANRNWATPQAAVLVPLRDSRVLGGNT